MTRLHIRQKILLTMLVVFIPSLLFLSFLIISSTSEILSANVTREVRGLAAKSAQNLDDLVQNSGKTLLVIAKTPSVLGFIDAISRHNIQLSVRQLDKMEKDFLNFQKLDRTIQAIRFIDPQGRVLAKVREGAIIPRKGPFVPYLNVREISSKKDRQFFKDAIISKKGEISISNMERGWMGGKAKWCPAMVRFSTPFFLTNGQCAGILTINVWGETAGRTINRLISKDEGSAFLIERNKDNQDRNGIYIFYQDQSCEFGNQTGSKITVFKQYPKIITDAWMNTDEGVNIQPGSRDIIAHRFYSPFHREDKGWVVVVNAKRRFFMAPLTTIKHRILWSTGLILALMITAAFWFASSITRPIKEVIDGTHSIGKDLSCRIPVRSDDEVGALAQEINLMAADLEQHLDDKKKIAEKICQSEKLASIGEMAAGIAHELNTPLGNARAIAALARQDLENSKCDPAALDEDLADILEQTDKCSRIISGMLSFARQQNPEFTYQDINELLASSISLLRIRSKEKGVSILFEKKGKLPLVKIDGHQVQQVFVNILLNAVDALDQGGQVAIRSRDVIDKIAIQFIDTGSGIEPEQMDKIFVPFFTTKEVGKGTGLGLSVSYGIVKNHGGTIEVESIPNEGTVFTVFLPTGDNLDG
ncbi:MAG: HAMP domain-containing histidine kinase [Deltaproteobacteria bacterium]|nr:HAMP domain-containing histidine kinase [Deltaproteobacteria bacterium]